MSSASSSRLRDRRSVGSDNLLQLTERRLIDAEARVERAQMVVAWQQQVVEQMRTQGRRDAALGQEVLAMLRESLAWSEAQAKQARADLAFLKRHTA